MKTVKLWNSIIDWSPDYFNTIKLIHNWMIYWKPIRDNPINRIVIHSRPFFVSFKYIIINELHISS